MTYPSGIHIWAVERKRFLLWRSALRPFDIIQYQRKKKENLCEAQIVIWNACNKVINVCGETDRLKLHELPFHKDLLRLLWPRCALQILEAGYIHGWPLEWSSSLWTVKLRSGAKESLDTMQMSLILSVVISLVSLGSRISAGEYFRTRLSVFCFANVVIAWSRCFSHTQTIVSMKLYPYILLT